MTDTGKPTEAEHDAIVQRKIAEAQARGESLDAPGALSDADQEAIRQKKLAMSGQDHGGNPEAQGDPAPGKTPG